MAQLATRDVFAFDAMRVEVKIYGHINCVLLGLVVLFLSSLALGHNVDRSSDANEDNSSDCDIR